jgi:hypothetical protein
MSRRRKKPGPAQLPPAERAGHPPFTVAADERTPGRAGVMSPVSGEGELGEPLAEAEPPAGGGASLDPAGSLGYPQRDADEVDPTYTDPPTAPDRPPRRHTR